MKKSIIANLITLILLVCVTLYTLTLRKNIKNESKKCSYELVNFNYNHKNESNNPSIVLLGNSLIRKGNWDTLLKRTDLINRGIAGDRLHCICERLSYLDEYSPKIAFIEGGINDLPGQETDSLYNNYLNIIAYFKNRKIIPVINCVLKISPKAKEMYPQRKDYQAINNQVEELDRKLISYAQKNNIDFIDLNDSLSDKSLNVLKEKYTTDGVHLTKPAYAIWADKITAILYKYKI